MLTIGVTTYNRKSILKRMASSFYSSDIPYEYNIRVYDDASQELNEESISAIFPDAKSIIVRSKNIGSDANIRLMYEDFLNYGDEFFFNADSDLIFNKKWISILMDTIQKTDGIISAFNTSRHRCINAHTVDGVDIVEKESLGSAGTLFRRDIVETIVKSMEEYDAKQFDWKWSSSLREQGKHLYALKNSMVQHIGFSGFNAISGYFDYGWGYCVDSVENGQAINDTVEEMTQNTHAEYRKRVSVFPFSEVEKGSNVVIFGAGRFGKDYISQIECLDYCNIVAVCDTHYENMEGVINPKHITDMDYDYVIVSVQRDDSVKIIKETLLELGVSENKIITGSGSRLWEIN